MSENTTAELCKHDGKPCYASAGTPDAHWRCGTAQCQTVLKIDRERLWEKIKNDPDMECEVR